MKWAFFALFSGFQSVPAPPRTPINRSDDGARDKETEKDYSDRNDPRCSTNTGSISLVMVSDDREGEDFGMNHEGEGIDSGLETAESGTYQSLVSGYMAHGPPSRARSIRVSDVVQIYE